MYVADTTFKGDVLQATPDQADKWMEITYDQKKLVLLPHNHPFARLYAKHIHGNYYHIGPGGAKRKFRVEAALTVEKIVSRFWVTN